MIEQERLALWAKRAQIETAERVAWRKVNQPGPFLEQALRTVERLRAEYDALYAAVSS